MSTATHRVVAVVALTLTIASTTSCRTSNLAFVRDNRVKIAHPDDGATVRLPLTVSWTVEDFDGRFAIFIDRAPIEPGERLRSLVPREDGVCRANPACPDAAWLAARQVIVTDGTEITLETLADRRSTGRQTDRHELVIVLLRGDRRVGESAFVRDFTVDRSES